MVQLFSTQTLGIYLHSYINSFQQLRKLMLEIILRTSTNEALKNLTKDIQKTMLRLVTIENEENAILAIKILLDQGKANRFQPSQEVGNVNS